MDANSLKGRFVVSCQAYEDNPLYGTENMVTLAKCAISGGAQGLRLCWPEQIAAVRKITDLPIIGINKIMNGSRLDVLQDVFITPTFEAAAAIIEAGCDVVAMDGTLRKRSYRDLEAIVKEIKAHYPDIILMADISNIEEGRICENLGFDVLSTTLSGYTSYKQSDEDDEPDYQLAEALKKQTNCIVNAEGRIWDIHQLQRMMDTGADMVTIGSAITNPMKITGHFIRGFNKKVK